MFRHPPGALPRLKWSGSLPAGATAEPGTRPNGQQNSGDRRVSGDD